MKREKGTHYMTGKEWDFLPKNAEKKRKLPNGFDVKLSYATGDSVCVCVRAHTRACMSVSSKVNNY